MKRVAVYVLTTCVLVGLLHQRHLASQINTVKELAPGVYFHEGDLKRKGHCNNGWVIFDDYVLVLDANFPSGAQEIIPKIKAQTSKPIRFAFDTHHHGDHAYGNQALGRQRRGSGRPRERRRRDAEVRDRALRRQARTLGGRGQAARGSQSDAAEGAVAALSGPDDLRRRQAPRRAALLRRRPHARRRLRVAPEREDPLYRRRRRERSVQLHGRRRQRRVDRHARQGPEAWSHRRGAGHGPAGDAGVLEAQRQYFVALRAEVEKRKVWRPTASRPMFPPSATRSSSGTPPTSMPAPNPSPASNHRSPRSTRS